MVVFEGVHMISTFMPNSFEKDMLTERYTTESMYRKIKSYARIARLG